LRRQYGFFQHQPPGAEHPARSAKPLARLAVVKNREKRGTTKTTRNDYYGVRNGTRVEMDKRRGRFLGGHEIKIAQMF